MIGRNETEVMEASPTAVQASQSEGLSYQRLLWSSLLSVAVVGIIGYYTFELEEFQQLVTQVHVWPLVAIVVTLVCRVLVGGMRLSYISRGKLSLYDGTRGQLAWDFFSNVSPSAIGGGPFAAVFISRERRIPLGEATAIMLFAMLLDQFWFVALIPPILLAMPFIQVFPVSIGEAGTLAFMGLFAGMLAWLGIFGYAVLFRPELLHSILDVFFRIKWLRRWRARVAKEMSQLGVRSKVLRGQRPMFYVNSFLLTLIIWISRLLLPLFIIWSVYPEADKLLVVARSAAMSTGTVVLPTPGGSGGVEGLYMLFVGPLLPAALVAPTLLAWRFLGYFLFLGLGVFLSMHHVQRSIRLKRQVDGRTVVTDLLAPGDGADEAVMVPRLTEEEETLV